MIDERELDRRTLRWLLAAALGIRCFAAAFAPVPGVDAVNHLWMAEQFAAGDAAAGLAEVFPPGMSLLITPWVALGIEPFRAGQLVATLCGALSLWPTVRAVEAVLPRGGAVAGTMLVLSPLAVRLAGQVYTEPVFHLFGALALWAMVRGRFAAAGFAAAAAFWVRPEAAAFAVAFVVADRRRGWLGVGPLVAGIVALAAWRSSGGHGFELLPKLGLHVARGDTPLTDSGFDTARLLDNLMRLPGSWLEAFQIVGVLALFGMWRARREQRLRPHLVLLGVAVMAIVVFLTRRRFLVAWIFVLAPFAVVGLRALPARARFPVVFVILLTSLLGSLKIEPTDRIGEKEVGVYLRRYLQPGEVVEGDMTRVIYFAGCRPLPPIPLTVAELVDRARRPEVRFVVLGSRRTSAAPVREALASEFGAFALPEVERRAATMRGILVLERQ